MAWTAMYFPNKPCLIISNESRHASFLFRILLHIYDKLPWWMKPMISSRQEEEGLIFNNPDPADRRVNPGLQSEVLVQAATQISGVGGQGRRIAGAHLSEYCDWNDDAAKEIIEEDLTPALGEDPDAFAFLESTAKGAGRYAHKFWRNNLKLKEEAEWLPVFLPWFFEKNRVMLLPDGWRPQKKEAETRDRAMRDWLKCSEEACQEYRESVIYPELFDEPCPRCKKGKMVPLLIRDEQLRWMEHRRLNTEHDEKSRKLLKQEYAATGEESFQISGYQVFGDDVLEYVNSTIREPLARGDVDSRGNFHAVKIKDNGQCYQPWCRINHKNDDNPLQIWKYPEEGRDYVAGVDVSEGLGGESDSSVIAVNLKGRFPGEPDEIVAIYRSNTIDPLPLGAVCNWIGRWYNSAMMSIECNKYDTVLSQLRQNWAYGNIFRWKWVDSTNMLSNKWGWYTQSNSKPRLYQTAKKWLKDRCWIIPCSDCLEEMKTFQKESPEERGAGAEDNMHDDILMSCMIALYTAHDMDSGEVQDTSGPPRVNTNQDINTGMYTATCMRCPAPAWETNSPQHSFCPSCKSRNITAKTNTKMVSAGAFDFNELGKDPDIPGDGIPPNTFEYGV